MRRVEGFLDVAAVEVVVWALYRDYQCAAFFLSERIFAGMTYAAEGWETKLVIQERAEICYHG